MKIKFSDLLENIFYILPSILGVCAAAHLITDNWEITALTGILSFFIFLNYEVNRDHISKLEKEVDELKEKLNKKILENEKA